VRSHYDQVARGFIGHAQDFGGGISFDQTVLHWDLSVLRPQLAKAFPNRIQIHRGWKHKQSVTCYWQGRLHNVQNDEPGTILTG
jgi:hypothetical protein